MDDFLDFSQMSKIEGERGRRGKVGRGGGGRWARISVNAVQGRISATVDGIMCRVNLC